MPGSLLQGCHLGSSPKSNPQPSRTTTAAVRLHGGGRCRAHHKDINMSAFNYRIVPHIQRDADRLAASGDFRILRRLPEICEVWAQSSPVIDRLDMTKIAVVDVETTGLDPATAKIIEIAIVSLTICDRTGALIDIQPPKSWLEDPSEPLSEEIEQLVGLTYRDLAGQRFDDEAILAALHEADIICAHNMAFDYSHLIQRFPSLESGFACSMKDIAWRKDHDLGQLGLSVGALLAAAGYFASEAHRAGPDTWATAMLLIMHASDGRTIASHMIDAARRTSIRLFAKGAPFGVKDNLRAAGYRWSAKDRVWWKEGDSEAMANEAAWLVQLCSAIIPQTVRIDHRNRHTG
jgi:DNA polymerase III subunit epsilon